MLRYYLTDVLVRLLRCGAQLNKLPRTDKKSADSSSSSVRTHSALWLVLGGLSLSSVLLLRACLPACACLCLLVLACACCCSLSLFAGQRYHGGRRCDPSFVCCLLVYEG